MDNTNYDLLPEIRDMLNSVYGEENWSIEQYNSKHIIIIKFDEVEITNSLYEKHTIKQLYVWVHINPTTGILRDYNLYGCRSYLTVDELLAKYAHSHLRYHDRASEFCLGSTEIRGLLYDCYEEYDKDKFHMLLFFINNYVKWESLEGVPYKKIDNIGVAGRSSISSLSYLSSSEKVRFTKEYLTSNHIPDIAYDELTNKFIVEENDKFMNQLLDLGCTRYKYDITTEQYLITTDLRTNVDQALNSMYTDATLPTFKGVEIKINVDMSTYPNDEDEEYGENYVDRPHKQLIDYVGKRVSKEIYNNYKLKLIEI